MSENTETRLIELFTEKIDEIREEFEREREIMREEREKSRKRTNGFLLGFGALILTFVFGSGMVYQKVNSMESKYYKVEDKVEALYMVAVKNGDIQFSTRGVDSNGD